MSVRALVFSIFSHQAPTFLGISTALVTSYKLFVATFSNSSLFSSVKRRNKHKGRRAEGEFRGLEGFAAVVIVTSKVIGRIKSSTAVPQLQYILLVDQQPQGQSAQLTRGQFPHCDTMTSQL